MIYQCTRQPLFKNKLSERIDSSFFVRTCLTISSINSFWMSLCIYLCWPDSRWLFLPRCVNSAGTFLFNSLKSCVTLTWPSLPLKGNPWRARDTPHYIIFVKYFLSTRCLLFKSLTVISNTLPHWGTTDSYVIGALYALDRWWSTQASRVFLPIIKPLRFLHIMFCC